MSGGRAPTATGSDRAIRPVKRSFTIAGHRTSVSLEGAFWTALQEAAAARNQSVSALVAEIDRDRGQTNLSSALRVWLFERARERATPPDTLAETLKA
jgi:predicted DNA-binding ribbon-helix-helix protein